MKKINFAFWGTPDIASNTLELLKDNGYIPNIIITSVDTRAGRGMHLSQTPVSIWAEKNNIKCLKPEKITPLFINELSLFDIDISIVVAYGKILPEKIINLPKLGTINIHYSLLPKYRGASPLESCLLNGDQTTGVSIQQMQYKLDSGPILIDEEINIGINTSKNELKVELIKLGGKLLCNIFPRIIEKEIIPKIQNEKEATYCTKIKKEDGLIDLNKNNIENYNKYRAFYGWPGVYFFANQNGRKIRIKINEATYEKNTFVIKKVTPEGRKLIDYSIFLKQN